MLNALELSDQIKAAAYLADELRKQLITPSKNTPCYSDGEATLLANHFKQVLLTALKNKTLPPEYEKFILQQTEDAASLLIGKMDTSVTPIKVTGLTQIMHEFGKKYSVGFFGGNCQCSNQPAMMPNTLFQVDYKKLTTAAKEKEIMAFILKNLAGVEYCDKALSLPKKAEKLLKIAHSVPAQGNQELALRKASMALVSSHIRCWIVGNSYETFNIGDSLRLYNFFLNHITSDVFKQLSATELNIISQEDYAKWAVMVMGERVKADIIKGWWSGKYYPDFKFTQLLDFNFKHLATVYPNADELFFYKLKPEAELLTYKQILIDEIVQRTHSACLKLQHVYKANQQLNATQDMFANNSSATKLANVVI